MSGAIPVAAPGRLAEDERRDVMAAVDIVLRSGHYIGGSHVDDFEQAFAAYVGGGSRCVAVGNGSDALVIALAALDLEPGHTVLVPPNDGGFAAAAVQAAGLAPALMDVCGATGLVGVAEAAAAWTPDVVAVVVTHLHGQAAEALAVKQWCGDRGIRLVEDCAQAHGAVLGANPVGSIGDAAAFSFYPTKNLGAMGDGGAVLARDPRVTERARALRQYGWGERYKVTSRLGRNSRLDAVQAAVLAARLPFLDRNNRLRRDITQRYRQSAPGLSILGRADESFVAHHAVVVVDHRDVLLDSLDRAGVGHDVHYPYLVQEMPGILLAGPHKTPEAGRLRDRIVSVPCFPTMRDDEVNAVCGVLQQHEALLHA